MNHSDLYLKKRKIEHGYDPKKLRAYTGVTRLNKIKEIAQETGTIKKYMPQTPKKWRTKAIRAMLEMMPGKTIEEKRAQLQKISFESKRDLAGFMDIKADRGTNVRNTIVESMVCAGAEKLRPSELDLLEKIKKGQIHEDKKAYYDAKFRVLLGGLEEAGIVKTERVKGQRIIGFDVVDQKRLDETMRTGYVQWPKSEPLIKRSAKK